MGAGVVPSAASAYCLARLLAMRRGADVLWAHREPGAVDVLQDCFQPHVLVTIPERVAAALDRLPLVDACIEYALCASGKNIAAELAELARVLQVGGIAALQVAHWQPFIAALETGDYPLAVLADLALRERGRAKRLVVLERLAGEQPALLQIL